MIRNLIFDMGGILVDLNRERCVSRFADINFDVTPYLGQYEQTGPFGQLEAGCITEREFYDAIDCPAGDSQKRDAWTSFLDGLPAHRLEAIADLRRRGFRTFMLSNTNIIDWQFIVSNYLPRPVSEYFERTFLSFEMHLLKPSPEIFTHSLALAALKPDETLFIDDSERNCNAAESVGIHSLCALGDEWIKVLAQTL